MPSRGRLSRLAPAAALSALTAAWLHLEFNRETEPPAADDVVKKEGGEELPALRNASAAPIFFNENTVFFTRIPGAGAAPFERLLHVLRARNAFYVHTDRTTAAGGDGGVLSYQQQSKMVGDLFNVKEGHHIIAYAAHGVRFVDFESFGQPSPLFVAIIRDPVERFVARFVSARPAGENPAGTRQALEACILSYGDDGCRTGDGGTWSYDPQVAYFCGYYPDCSSAAAAGRRARSNLELYYRSAGPPEAGTVRLLQFAAPRFFRAAEESLADAGFNVSEKNSTAVSISATARSALAAGALRHELEFHAFVLQWLAGRLAAVRAGRKEPPSQDN